jgi:hypothetical protein
MAILWPSNEPPVQSCTLIVLEKQCTAEVSYIEISFLDHESGVSSFHHAFLWIIKVGMNLGSFHVFSLNLHPCDESLYGAWKLATTCPESFSYNIPVLFTFR